jgi:hypothetical protein
VCGDKSLVSFSGKQFGCFVGLLFRGCVFRIRELRVSPPCCKGGLVETSRVSRLASCSRRTRQATSGAEGQPVFNTFPFLPHLEILLCVIISVLLRTKKLVFIGGTLVQHYPRKQQNNDITILQSYLIYMLVVKDATL